MNPFCKVFNPFEMKTPLPTILEIDLTNFCNQNCKFCKDKAFRDEMAQSLSVETVKELSSQLIGRLSKIIISGGGEPTVHPKFESLMRNLAETGAKLVLVTNGELLESFAHVIKETCGEVIISIDANSFHAYNKLHRGTKFSHPRVLSGIKQLTKNKERNYSVVASFLINAYNYFEVESFIETMSALKVDKVLIRSMFIRGFDLTEKIKNSVLSALKPKEGMTIDYNLDNCGGTCKKCFAIDFHAVVAANSKVYPCPGLRGKASMILGDLKQNTFEDIWNSDRKKKIIEKLEIDRCPQNCEYIKYNNAISLIFEE